MVDASMVVVLRQPNSREESKSIKNGDVAEDWNDNQKGQKDTDAGWMKKNELNHFGNQNQIEIDVKHKLIGRGEVSPASVHDRHVWPELRAENNSRQDGWADSADGSASKRDTLKEDGYRGHIQPTGGRDKKLTQPQIEADHQPWKTSRQVEPIFRIQQIGASNLMIGSRGLARTKGKIGWRSLADNIDRLDRYCRLAQP